MLLAPSTLLLFVATASVPADVASPLLTRHETVAPQSGAQAGTPSSSEADEAEEEKDEAEEAGNPVPEAATLLLVGTGLVGIALSRRRWRRALPAAHPPSR